MRQAREDVRDVVPLTTQPRDEVLVHQRADDLLTFAFAFPDPSRVFRSWGAPAGGAHSLQRARVHLGRHRVVCVRLRVHEALAQRLVGCHEPPHLVHLGAWGCMHVRAPSCAQPWAAPCCAPGWFGGGHEAGDGSRPIMTAMGRP